MLADSLNTIGLLWTKVLFLFSDREVEGNKLSVKAINIVLSCQYSYVMFFPWNCTVIFKTWQKKVLCSVLCIFAKCIGTHTIYSLRKHKRWLSSLTISLKQPLEVTVCFFTSDTIADAAEGCIKYTDCFSTLTWFVLLLIVC